MSSEQLTQTLFPSKKEKLQSLLNWIDENCDQHQKEEVSKLIGEYGDIMTTFPNEEFMRCSHAVDSISTPPTKEEVNQMPTSKARELLNEEEIKRKQLVNGLIMEMEEIKHQKNKL